MLCNDRSANAERCFCSHGSELKPVYHTKIDKEGNIELEVTGYQNMQEKIEAERAGVELSVLIARYENGDLLALNSREGFYGDVTNFPGSLIDAMNIVNDAQAEFDKLPVDIKKEFGSDWKKWLAQFGSEDWIKFMEPVFKPAEKAEENNDDVKENDNG